VLIGNPGVGKSTFLNGFLNEIRFESGLSVGTGLTSICQKFVDSTGGVYIDTPGLSDLKLREQAAVEIRKALQSSGIFKIFFVITLEEGRIRPDDKTTMKLVLDAAPIGSLYSVIINKLRPKLLQILQDEKQLKTLKTLLNEQLPGTEHFFLNAYDGDLDSENNKLPKPNPHFYQFVARAPYIVIKPEQVGDIKVSLFEAEKETLMQEIAKLQNNTEELTKRILEGDRKIEEQNKRQEAELAKIYTHNQTAMEKHEAEMRKLVGNLEKTKEEFQKEQERTEAREKAMKQERDQTVQRAQNEEARKQEQDRLEKQIKKMQKENQKLKERSENAENVKNSLAQQLADTNQQIGTVAKQSEQREKEFLQSEEKAAKLEHKLQKAQKNIELTDKQLVRAEEENSKTTAAQNFLKKVSIIQALYAGKEGGIFTPNGTKKDFGECIGWLNDEQACRQYAKSTDVNKKGIFQMRASGSGFWYCCLKNFQ